MIVQYFEKTHEIFVTPLHLHSNSQRVGDYSLIILHHSTNTRTGSPAFQHPRLSSKKEWLSFSTILVGVPRFHDLSSIGNS